MAQGGATDTGYSEELIENIVKYIREKPDLVEKLQELLKDNEDFKNLNKEFNELSAEDVTNLLKNSKEVLDNVVKHFTENKKDLEILLEQASKVKGMEGKLEALGNQLLTQGVIGGAAITTLTGALAGLAIGGVTGALIGGGLALAGLVVLVAIAVIGYAIYQHRGKIKEGTVEWGKAIKSFVKDLIDKLPTVQARENNFAKLKSDLLEQCRKSTGEEQTTLNNKIEIIRMLQDKDQRSAIEKLVEEIKDFSKENMKSLIDKGNSTHVEDMDKLKGFMDDFLPKIMEIGNGDIKKVEEKVNEKVKEMKPKSQVDDPSSKQVSPKEEIRK
ncbi:MAG: glycine zipper family protein [Wolbachia endosymbiont of Penenirmus auritus]|nr:glycine zipper family protein [Wolbachia endosymbiont of Penenirmus auritus]